MNKELNLSIFNPSGLSTAQKTQLENLLDELDAATAERKTYLGSGQNLALKAWLKNSTNCEVKQDLKAVYEAIPEDRFMRLLDKTYQECETAEEQALSQELQTLSYEEQKEAYMYISSSYGDFIDKSGDKKHWNKVDGIYKKILTQYPDILCSKEDLMGAVRLAVLIKNATINLSAAWKNAAGQTQMNDTKALLDQAYPEDDVSHLHVAPVSAKNIIAAFVTSPDADTLVLGEHFFKAKTPDFPLFLLTHEFQHRRQLVLKEKLADLSTGSTEYYQARLFSANFKGGYLSPVLATNKLNMVAKLRTYFEQPVEAQANMIAKIVCTTGDTNGAAMWELQERINTFLSDVARPVDRLVQCVQKGYSAAMGARCP